MVAADRSSGGSSQALPLRAGILYRYRRGEGPPRTGEGARGLRKGS